MFYIVSILILIIFYYVFVSPFQYWKKRNVPHLPPSYIFGNLGASITFKKSVGQIYTDIYNAFPGYLYVGFYKMRKPGIILRDPQLIRDVLGKDFNSFQDNDVEVDEKADPIGSRNPFVLKGQRWKIVKTQLTPCFTSKKLKGMFVLVEEAAKKLIKYMEQDPEVLKPDGVEVKELCAKYATEVVASCAFGLEGNVFIDPDSMFRKMGKKIFEPSLKTLINLYVLICAPFLSRFLKVSFISKPVSDYFLGIVRATIKYREENNIIRNDFLDFMIELKNKPGEYEFTELDIAAQAVGFFTDGFETTSSVMSYIFYELAANPKVQKSLRDGIESAVAQNNGKLDFDLILELKYLDAVINETLRLHPAGLFLLRKCTKSFTLPPPKDDCTGNELQLEVDTPIIIPVYSLHYNANYFKDPQVFNPDRFLPEHKNELVKGTFLPFGEGPRSCHGQRFALMQIKVIIANIVLKYDIKVSRKTILPLEIDPKAFINNAKGGIWLNFYKL